MLFRSPRRPSKEHAEAVRQEVAKLKQAGAIKEVFYPEWLANMVVAIQHRLEAEPMTLKEKEL